MVGPEHIPDISMYIYIWIYRYTVYGFPQVIIEEDMAFDASKITFPIAIPNIVDDHGT